MFFVQRPQSFQKLQLPSTIHLVPFSLTTTSSIQVSPFLSSYQRSALPFLKLANIHLQTHHQIHLKQTHATTQLKHQQPTHASLIMNPITLTTTSAAPSEIPQPKDEDVGM